MLDGERQPEWVVKRHLSAEALKEYEASQVREPNRLRGYAGAAEAARLSGDKARARTSYLKVIELAGSSQRPEVVIARKYTAN